MIHIPTDFYAHYGLQNVREAMKRPFAQAFPARATPPSTPPVPPTLPQLRSRSPSRSSQWQWHVEDRHEQAAKRRRIDGGQPPSPTRPTASTTSGGPGLCPRPKSAAQPGEVTSLSSAPWQAGICGTPVREEHTEAELANCAALLNLDSTTGIPLLKSVIAHDFKPLSPQAERLAYAKELIRLLDSLASRMEAGIGGLPESLGARLVERATRCLRGMHARREGNIKSSFALQIESLVLALFNENGAAYRKMKEHGSFDLPNACKFAGGKTRFQFIGWCVEKNIRLSDNELRCLVEMEISNNLKDYEAFLLQIRRLAIAYDELLTQLARSEKNSS